MKLTKWIEHAETLILICAISLIGIAVVISSNYEDPDRLLKSLALFTAAYLIFLNLAVNRQKRTLERFISASLEADVLIMQLLKYLAEAGMLSTQLHKKNFDEIPATIRDIFNKKPTKD